MASRSIEQGLSLNNPIIRKELYVAFPNKMLPASRMNKRRFAFPRQAKRTWNSHRAVEQSKRHISHPPSYIEPMMQTTAEEMRVMAMIAARFGYPKGLM